MYKKKDMVFWGSPRGKMGDEVVCHPDGWELVIPINTTGLSTRVQSSYMPVER